MRVCAYCGANEKLTREHIWPAYITRRQSLAIRYSEKANKVFGGDLTVSDVCATCNNGPLSKLDTYSEKLYAHYWSKTVAKDQKVIFRYDFGLLSRWLLKISYNASRTTNLDSNSLRPYAPTIASHGDCSPVQFAISVATIKPARVVDAVTRSTRLVPPLGVRCGRLPLHPTYQEEWCGRLVLINSYCFILMILKEASYLPENAADALQTTMRGVIVDPSGRVRIPKPEMDTMDAFHGVRNWPGIKEFGQSLR